MIHRFATFEIDVAARELRVGGRVLDVQPRVFDLLVYLAMNHERVVPKDELLDAVWPGVIVADASLQRAVSLARGALAEASVANAIRTFSRTGYRLCVDSKEPAHSPQSPTPSLSPARKLIGRALELLARRNPAQETLETVGQLIEQAKALDPVDADGWAVGAQTDCWFIFFMFDVSEMRRERARLGARRALVLDPRSYEARLAQASVLIVVVAHATARAEAETLLRELIVERPDEFRALELLGNLLRDEGHCDEAAALFVRAMAFNAAAWAFATANRFDEAMEVTDRIVAEDPSAANFELKAVIETWGREDLDAAAAALKQLPASVLLEDSPAAAAAFIHLYRGETEQVLATLRAIPRDWLAAGLYSGPKAWFSGRAHQLAGRTIAAQAEWRGGLACVEQRLGTQGNALMVLRWQALLLALLGETQEASRVLDLGQQLAGPGPLFLDQYWAEAAWLVGRQDAVEKWLEESLTHPTKPTWFMHAILRFDPAFAPLHRVPRWAKLLRDTLPVGAKPFARKVPSGAGTA
jgi:DNA-binding winged helix-turn-helix (wHTH) protein